MKSSSFLNLLKNEYVFQRINETIENEMSITNRFNNSVFFKKLIKQIY